MPAIPASPKAKEFDELLLSAIDNAFLSLGESVKKSIYFHLEEKFNLKKEQIPLKLNKFQEALEQIFGSGARFLEILIMKNLYMKVDKSIAVEKQSVCFVEYVKEMKKAYIKQLT
ncbi:MAG: hypothetical protein ACQCN3_06370 [Candidatus Bathyarchaeia archaeon]|jgi:hypothetical protein